MKNVKGKIKLFLKNRRSLYRIVKVIYTAFLHPKRLMKRKSLGDEHPNKTILIIRPNSEDAIQGLLSLFVQSVRWLQYAKEHNYLSYVDYKTYRTQYYDGNNNAWDFFFQQPDKLDYDEVYRSNNVVLSGVSLQKTTDDTMFRENVFKDKKSLNKCHDILVESIRFTDEVLQLVESENRMLHVEDCIGVYIRGTDYAKMKPPGEFRQPEIADVVVRVKDFVTRYPGKKIFLVTEDYDYYRAMKQDFPELLTIVSFDSFITGYDGKDYLSRTKLLEKNKKKRGMDYLVKIILLSRCRYLISSITMGSIAAYCFNGGRYKDEYIFDLGVYS